ncbi:MAG: enoyl-CoA hydratase-related protein, partial [Chloroflexota bacterium]
ESERIAELIAANAPVAVRISKEAVLRGLDVTLDQGLRLENDLSNISGATEDAKEGPRAFAEKRAPQWKGR